MFKSRLVYLIVVFVLFQLVYIYENDMTYVAFYAALILPVLSLALTHFLRSRFVVDEKLSAAEVTKGETLEYIFTLTNNSFMLCTNVSVSFEADKVALVSDINSNHFSVPPYKSHSLTFSVGTKYRGVYSVGVSDITLYDFLGLFKFKQKHGKKLEFIVNPKIAFIPSLPISSAAQDSADIRNFLQDENYSVISDLRKYQPGDGYKKIHWKLSAKKGELISKNFQATQMACTTLIFDNSYITSGSRDNALAVEDSMIEALVSVIAYCREHDLPVDLRFMGMEAGDSTSCGFDYLYSVAAGIRFGKFGRFGDYFVNQAKVQTEAISIVLFLQQISDDVIATVKAMLLFGNNIIAFVFSRDSSIQRGLAQLHDLGIYCISYGELTETKNPSSEPI